MDACAANLYMELLGLYWGRAKATFAQYNLKGVEKVNVK
jgi:hypothetical protein